MNERIDDVTFIVTLGVVTRVGTGLTALLGRAPRSLLRGQRTDR